MEFGTVIKVEGETSQEMKDLIKEVRLCNEIESALWEIALEGILEKGILNRSE